MALVSGVATVFPAQMWPQGDARDPLGVWGGRVTVTGDGTGGGTKAFFDVPEARRSAHVFTCYAVTIAQIVGTPTTPRAKLRLLTNWPDVDPVAQVQGFATFQVSTIEANANFSVPTSGLGKDGIGNWPGSHDRFILLLDPRQGISEDLTIVEMELGENILNNQWVFEAYGYYWDRGVLNTPGGPRHPGSA